MATPPKHPTPPNFGAQHRADDTERAKVRQESHARGVEQDTTRTRNDPQAQGNKDRLAAENAQRAIDSPNEPPLAPQVGMSSSELNSATPSMKEKATEEAKSAPGGDDDKGVEERRGARQKENDDKRRVEETEKRRAEAAKK